MTVSEPKVSVSVEDRANRILASKYLVGPPPPPWMERLALLIDDAREIATYALTAQSAIAERDAEIAEMRDGITRIIGRMTYAAAGTDARDLAAAVQEDLGALLTTEKKELSNAD